MAERPTSALVAVAWLRTLPDLRAGVATSLPTDPASWQAEGFVTVEVVGGSGSSYVPWRAPAVSAHFWAVRPGASAPPYGKAAALAETVRAAALAFASPVDVVPTPGNYGPARVHAASLLQDEPLRIPEPDSAYAHYTMDLQMEWVAL